MRKTKNIKYSKDAPPLNTIVAAIHKDSQAIDELLAFYQPYIQRLASRELFDASGYTCSVVDEQVRRQLEIKLIAAILEFEIR